MALSPFPLDSDVATKKVETVNNNVPYVIDDTEAVRVETLTPSSHASHAVGLNEGPIVTRRELWSYYLYYNGDNNVGTVYSLTLFQSLATRAAFDSRVGRHHPCDQTTPSSACLLPWGKGTKTVSSVILVTSGVSFATTSVLFATISSAADYGSFGRWLLLTVTFIAWGAQFATMSLTSPDRWIVAMMLQIIGSVAYMATLTFIGAVFPRLARNTPNARALRAKYECGELSAEEYEIEQSLEKNKISIISLIMNASGYTMALALGLSILIPLSKNTKVDNYTIVLGNVYWVVTGIWWFIFQQRRPGPKLPKGESYLTIGWKQIYQASRQYKKLSNTFIYLLASFLLSDGFVTTIILVIICQNDQFKFSFLQTTYLNLVLGLTSTISCLGCWYIQRYWKIRTKTMFLVTNVFTILVPLWGMTGIWTTKIGFHNAWEFWAYNAMYGIFQVPYFAYSRTLVAELTPPGFENMFFGLFGLTNHASSMIGPNVIQSIINNTENNWKGFPFMFALCSFAALIVWLGVDVQKGQKDAIRFANEQRKSCTFESE